MIIDQYNRAPKYVLIPFLLHLSLIPTPFFPLFSLDFLLSSCFHSLFFHFNIFLFSSLSIILMNRKNIFILESVAWSHFLSSFYCHSSFHSNTLFSFRLFHYVEWLIPTKVVLYLSIPEERKKWIELISSLFSSKQLFDKWSFSSQFGFDSLEILEFQVLLIIIFHSFQIHRKKPTSLLSIRTKLQTHFTFTKRVRGRIEAHNFQTCRVEVEIKWSLWQRMAPFRGFGQFPRSDSVCGWGKVQGNREQSRNCRWLATSLG